MVRWLILLALGALMFLFHGYQFGTGDHAELFPLVLKYKNPSLFTTDLFINEFADRYLHERTLIAGLLAYTPVPLRWLNLLLHIVFMLVLVAGLMRWVQFYLPGVFWQSVAVFLILVGTYGRNLAGHELFYVHFQGSNIANAIMVWAAWHLVARNYVWGFGLAALGALFQPLVGMWFFVVFGTAVWLMPRQGFWPSGKVLYGMGLWLLSAGLFIGYIAWQQGTDKALTPQQFITMAFGFRMPHHYFLSHFPVSNVLFYVVMVVAGLWFFRGKHQLGFRVLLLFVVGSLVNYLLTEIWPVKTVVAAAWFRMGLWVKPLGIFALLYPLAHNIKISLPKYFYITVCLLILVLTVAVVWQRPGWWPIKRDYQMAVHHYPNNPEVDVCKKIKQLTPDSAIIIQPLGFTSLHYFGQRSPFVAFKQIPRTPAYLTTWYQRVITLYGVDTTCTACGYALHHPANSYYQTGQWLHGNTHPATHAIVYNKTPLPTGAKVLYKNNTYSICRLP